MTLSMPRPVIRALPHTVYLEDGTAEISPNGNIRFQIPPGGFHTLYLGRYDLAALLFEASGSGDERIHEAIKAVIYVSQHGHRYVSDDDGVAYDEEPF